MARNSEKILRAAEKGFALQDADIAEARMRNLLSVVNKTATGTGDIDETFGLDSTYRLVFIRCHFSGTAGTDALALSVDSGSGSVYDAQLFTITQAGTSSDVHLRIEGDDLQEPSPWTFQPADKLRVEWTNPDSGNITWGLEVGLALAS